MRANFYIQSLLIQNFATFRNQAISFRPGFNAIVGETGSGKSLVLDALQLILGSRADKKIVRRETDCSLIEASFYCADENIKRFLADEGFPFENCELVIKRLIYKNGTSKTYINHLSCTLSFLSAFAKRYIDLVGQFENQKLLSGSYQLHLLDHFANLHTPVAHFKALLKEYRAALIEQSKLQASKTQREQRLDYLTYQLSEIEKLNPSSQDEEELLRKKNSLVNLEKTQKLSLQVRDVFEGFEGQQGLHSLLKQLSTMMVRNKEIMGDQQDQLSILEEALTNLQANIERNFDHDLNPEELELVIDRLDAYQKIKRKFGGDVEKILQTQVEFLKEKNVLEELDVNLEGINLKLINFEKQLQASGEKLHQLRKAKAKKLAELLTEKVRLLKMDGATIRIDLSKTEEFLESGMTKAHFTAETNSGEGFYKIQDIASGGELSRILLSVRQILSSFDSISIFLFDEIDTGIGGETANCIGRALKEVATNGQVIAITHLPQIAKFAENLIVVNKETQKEKSQLRTESSIREISGKHILKEVQAMAQLH